MTLKRTYRTPPGQLRHQVTLQRFTQTGTDDRNRPVGTWEDVATLYAEVKPLTGRLAEYAHEMWESATLRVTINYRSDVTSADRFDFNGRQLAIGTVQNLDEANHTLVCLCTEAP